MIKVKTKQGKEGTEAGALVQKLAKLSFKPTMPAYRGQVVEVELGATRAEGGSRSHVIKIGGERTLPYRRFDGPTPFRPVVALDVFDMPIHLAGPVREHYADVLGDPAAWAKLCVEKFGADLVTIHLISTDPGLKNTSPQEAAKTVEEILQAVNVPVIIGGSGNKQKDPLVLAKAAEVAEGERCMLNAAAPDLNYRTIAEAAKKHGHVVLSWTPLDVNNQRRLNQALLSFGVPKNCIVMDPTTAALGYGIEYSFSVMERIRLAALKGDETLQMPMSSGTTNAWGAREAWSKAPELGPREHRGPLWEAVTALTLLLAGCDLFMMMHPTAMKALFETIDALMNAPSPEDIATFPVGDWVKMRVGGV